MEEKKKIKPNGLNAKRIRRKRILTIVLVLIIAISIASAIYYVNVIVTWIVPSYIPSVTLVSPPNNSTLYNATVQFNWTSHDNDSDVLTHVWYCDINPNFISPYLIVANEGQNLSHNETLDDGIWYWKVEVSDNDGMSVSEVWKLTVTENTSNHFPSLSNPSVMPSSGYTNTAFTYSVTYTDADNDTPAYVKVYIDSTPYNMVEQNSSDTNTTDGKVYTYTTHLSIGTHNYTFTCSDGDAINSTDIYAGPTVTSTPPVQSNESPSNGSTNVDLTPTLSVTCTDYDNDIMTAYWWSNSSGSWQQFASNTSIANGTIIKQTNSNFSDYNTTYWWSVNLTDGHTWTNKTYHFTTKVLFVNHCPQSSNPSIPDGSTNVNVHVKYWNITITDVDGNLTNGTIECTSGDNMSWTQQPDGVKSLQFSSTLNYGVTYTVYVNFTDGNCTVNETYTFTTQYEVIVNLIEPTNNTRDVCPCCASLCAYVANANGSLMNITFNYWEFNTTQTYTVTFYNKYNGTYCIYASSVVKYDTTYQWNITLQYNNLMHRSNTWSFTTVATPDDCNLTGNSNFVSYSWLVGVIIVFFSIPLGLILRNRRRFR